MAKAYRWDVLGLVLASWVLLCWRLGQRSLWIDEFMTIGMIQGNVRQVIAATTSDVHPPLYFLALHAWRALAGQTEFAVRWFSSAAGIVGVALMSGVSRRLLGQSAVLPATTLLGLSPAFIEFSRMARYYSLALALGLASALLLLEAARAGRLRWGAYGLTGLAMLYTFYPSGVLIGAHGLLLLYPAHRRKRFLAWAVTIAIVGALFAPWFLFVVGSQAGLASEITQADFARSALGFALGLASAAYTFGVGETLFPWRPEAWCGLLAIIALLGRGIFWRGRQAPWQQAGLVGVSLVFVSVVTTFVASGTPFLNVPVRGLFILPYFLLIAAAGWMDLTSGAARWLIGGAVGLAWGSSLLNQFAGQQFLNPIYLTPAKEAAALVRQSAAPADLVISDYDSVFGYYFLPGGTPPRHFYTDQVDEIQAALDVARPPRLWLVTIGRDRTRGATAAEAVRQLLAARGYTLDRVERYARIDPVYLRVKNFLLRRNSYEHRLEIAIYSLP